jgi:hypothetical protein
MQKLKSPRVRYSLVLYQVDKKVKSKAIPVTGLGGL